MTRVFNFAPGPAALPEEVLQQAADEMLDWHGTGMSVMEMSHRGAAFMSILEQAQNDLRELLALPADYEMLFMQGGAIAENSIVPLNLTGRNNKVDIVDTGSWSAKTITETRRYADLHIAASATAPRDIGDRTYAAYTYIPPQNEWQVRSDAAYLHICGNETIGGVEFFAWPDMHALNAANVPLVVDMSSHILSRPMDFSRFSLVYAGAQKNIGPAGLTLVIVHKDLLDRAHPLCPTAFNYQRVAENGSMYNTPPTYSIYIAGLVFAWLKKQGGLVAIEQRNIQKAKLLYSALDKSSLFSNPIEPSCRSRMNVPFILRDESLNESFLHEAKERGLVQLKGHKSVGGMRASIYNAMPIEGVIALVEFMTDFEKRYG